MNLLRLTMDMEHPSRAFESEDQEARDAGAVSEEPQRATEHIVHFLESRRAQTSQHRALREKCLARHAEDLPSYPEKAMKCSHDARTSVADKCHSRVSEKSDKILKGGSEYYTAVSAQSARGKWKRPRARMLL